MSATDPSTAGAPKLSWDAASTGAPERPTFASSIADEAWLDRPRRVIIAFVLVAIATVGCLALVGAAALRLEVVQDGLAAALPDDLISDYAEDDIARAVNLLLAAVAGVWIVLSLVTLLSALRLMTRRSRAGRAALIISAVVSVPVAALAYILRDGDVPGLAATAAVLVCLLVAVLIVSTAAVSEWLAQSERPAARSMVTARADELERRDA